MVCVDEEGNDVRLPPVRVSLTESTSVTTAKTTSKKQKRVAENQSVKEGEKLDSSSSSSSDKKVEKQGKQKKKKSTTSKTTLSADAVQNTLSTLATKAKSNVFQWLNKGKPQPKEKPRKKGKLTKESKQIPPEE